MSYKKRLLMAAAILLLASAGPWSSASTAVVTPEEYFGFRPGDDRKLIDYGQLVSYLTELDDASPRVRMIEIGQSPLGRKMYIAFISSEENIGSLERLREINRTLALDPDIGKEERERMMEEGRVFFLATLSMHSGEVAPSQSAPLIAHDLAVTADPGKLEWLDDVVYMMVPCHNPDGMDMIVEHYRKYHGTVYEGSSMPGVYHRYVGHDNNRDFVILSQKDTRAIADIYNRTWFPQVMVEKHQMGSTGARYFVPPNHDPIAENVDAELWNWTGIFGSNMMRDMTGHGLAGVSQHYLFDDYWPGSTETCIWKNVIGFLTEAASVKYATPVFIEENELAVYGKGLSEYKKSINMPLPWPGGWWRLGDIVEYEIVSTMSILRTCSNHRREILEFRNELCGREVERGRTEPPYYYIMPREQHDRSELSRMIDLMIEHGVTVYALEADVNIEGRIFEAGDVVIPLAQPFRPFIKEVMEAQRFPVRHYTPGGEMIRPYDITSWSLPLHRGVESFEISSRSEDLERALGELDDGVIYREELPASSCAVVLRASENESFAAVFEAMEDGRKVRRTSGDMVLESGPVPGGSFVVAGDIGGDEDLATMVSGLRVTPMIVRDEGSCDILLEGSAGIDRPRIALVETWFHDMDAGWTRYVFDSYGIGYEVLRPGDVREIDLDGDFDVVVFPGNDKDLLMSGKWKRRGEYYPSNYPPEYVEGLQKEGMDRLMEFLDGGGIIVAWGRSAELFDGTLSIPRGKDDAEEFVLPFSSMSERMEREGFFAPGALLEVILAPGHPLSAGMPERAGIMMRRGTAFRTSVPRFDMDRRVIARFPEKDMLLSGYIEKEESIGNSTAMVWLRKGKGQLVLFGFNPQFRASTPGTYKLLFNSLLLPRL